MTDSRALIVETFEERIARSPLLAGIDADEAVRLGREAAEAVLGPLVWRELLGADRLDTTQVARLLGITRQAVHKRVRAGALLGVPGRSTTWFPAWQFDVHGAQVRPVLPLVLRAWGETAEPEESSAGAILVWSQTPQPELGDLTPEDWIVLGKPDADVVQAARQAARALAG